MSAGGRQDRGAGTRAVAARVLDAVLHGGHSLKAELAAVLPQLPDPRDRALVEAIVFAALRQRARCEAALAQWMPRPPGRRDGILRALLYAGFVQLDALRLPPHAALAATVDAARLLGRAHQAGVVNALLRRAQRDGLPAVDAAAQWPAWLLDMLRRDRPAQLADIVRASAEPGPLWLRVNRRLATPEGMLARLAASRIAAVQVPACPDALRIDAPVPVSALPGFADGELSVQEGSAQLVADALSPMPAANVLDACSAPGGKAAHLLERDRSLRLLALDVDRKRLERVRATFARLALDGGDNVQLRVADATDTPAWWDGKPFDAILLDAPCSATGVVRRQPDILLHRRASDIDELVAGQARLLDALWAVLAPGGTLLYATCSILRRENDVQVAAFLARTPGARLQPLDARFGEDTGHGSQRLPGQDDMDGFFYARIGKPIHFAA